MKKETKRFVIAAVILWILGTAFFFWGYLDKEKQQQRLTQKRESYNAKLEGINKLTGNQEEIDSFKGIIDEAISSEKPDDITQNNNSKIIFYTSVICVASGAVILLLLLLLCIVHFIAGKISNLKKNLAQFHKSQKEAADILIESNSHEKEKVVLLTQKLYEPAKLEANISFTDQRKFHPSKRQIENPLVDPIKPDQRDKFFTNKSDFQVKSINHTQEEIRDGILSSYHENAMKVQDSLKQQAEKLERQVAEIKNLTQSVAKTSAGNDKPLDNNIGELAEQIAAIRNYASSQQDRVTKLQEGYDWNIIRTFCLRIIRCIDNIDSRIDGISQQGGDVSDLEDIKDDLVFALESSGVEQFEPEINSTYANSQKVAEAVKERTSCDEPDMKGSIAEIIKPGYRYVIDGDSAKVVRMAQVKLFG